MKRWRDNWRGAERGFTIIEMMMVVAIISILIGISFTAVTRSIEAGRKQKASALCQLVEQGITTYYAAYGEWPISDLPDRASDNGSNIYTLKADEVRKIISTVIKKQIETKQPMMDVSGLYVSDKDGEVGTGKYGNKYYGMDFMSAVCGTAKKPTGIRLTDMYFGYPESTSGYFRRFKIVYSPAADAISVSIQETKQSAYDRVYDEKNGGAE